MTDQDFAIINGLKANYQERIVQEKNLYQQYYYFIREGCRAKKISQEDSFNAYTDAVLSVIRNVVSEKFDGHSSLKTYLFQIFSNKCVDFIRRNTTNKEQVHFNVADTDLLLQMPEVARNAVEIMMTEEKQNAVKKYIETIGEKCKTILLMFEDGFSDKKIAAELKYNSAEVAKITRLRCLEKLKQNMQSVLKSI